MDTTEISNSYKIPHILKDDTHSYTHTHTNAQRSSSLPAHSAAVLTCHFSVNVLVYEISNNINNHAWTSPSACFNMLSPEKCTSTDHEQNLKLLKTTDFPKN